MVSSDESPGSTFHICPVDILHPYSRSDHAHGHWAKPIHVRVTSIQTGHGLTATPQRGLMLGMSQQR